MIEHFFYFERCLSEIIKHSNEQIRIQVVLFRRENNPIRLKLGRSVIYERALQGQIAKIFKPSLFTFRQKHSFLISNQANS